MKRADLDRTSTLAWLIIAAAVVCWCAATAATHDPAGLTESIKKPTGDVTFLVSETMFIEQEGEGAPKVPGPARLVMIHYDGSNAASEALEDNTGDVFHKAVACDLAGLGKGFLTISGDHARLLFWHLEQGEWKSRELWRRSFGGTHDRFRDLEIGDVNGDGAADLVVGTHDKGIIAVLEQNDGQWKATELGRTDNCFVHEIELGDWDGDGRLEIFATPSEPNRLGASQAGKIVMYSWNGEGYTPTTLDEWSDTHAKEIMAADLDNRGRVDVYATLLPKNNESSPVRIMRYRLANGKIKADVIATLRDKRCRYIDHGDLDGDGIDELVATGGLTGLWIIKKEADGGWVPRQLDSSPTGFVIPILLADLDRDGAKEIYLASSRRNALYRYTLKNGSIERSTLAILEGTSTIFHLGLLR
ncbi:VCBS repeat-containing protein [bacterium]|nr:VCBS repeat-containing protein [candidate division CSSED10-310 bacterium]